MTIEPWESLDPKADLLRRVKDIEQTADALRLLIDDMVRCGVRDGVLTLEDVRHHNLVSTFVYHKIRRSNGKA